MFRMVSVIAEGEKPPPGARQAGGCHGSDGIVRWGVVGDSGAHELTRQIALLVRHRHA